MNLYMIFVGFRLTFLSLSLSFSLNRIHYDITDVDDYEQICYAVVNKENAAKTTAVGMSNSGFSNLYDYKSYNAADFGYMDTGKEGQNDSINKSKFFNLSSSTIFGIVAIVLVVGAVIGLVAYKAKKNKNSKVPIEGGNSRREPLVSNPEVYVA